MVQDCSLMPAKTSSNQRLNRIRYPGCLAACIMTATLPSPFPGLRAAGSSTRGRVWEGVKKGNSYTIKITSLAKIAQSDSEGSHLPLRANLEERMFCCYGENPDCDRCCSWGIFHYTDLV